MGIQKQAGHHSVCRDACSAGVYGRISMQLECNLLSFGSRIAIAVSTLVATRA